MAMYKTRNTGTRSGMRGTRRIWGMLYSGKCCQTFQRMSPYAWGMLPNIAGSVAKHCRKCCQTFWRMFHNIPGNVLKHPGVCHSSKILGNAAKFWEMLPNILGNILKQDLTHKFNILLEKFTITQGSFLLKLSQYI